MRDRLKVGFHVRVVVALLAFCWLWSTDARAQHDASRPVLRATLVHVDASLRDGGEARITGPIAFDPRVLVARREAAPRNWPDSLALTWVGNVRDSVHASAEVAAMLEGANGAGQPVRWLPCGSAAGARSCLLTEFPAVVSLSKPWISGDVAEVLVLVRYRSSIALHPLAWMANVLRLERVGGEWTVTGGHNWGGT